MKIGGIQKLSLADYPGKTCAVLFTIGCNMCCGYCHNPELVIPDKYIDNMPLEDIYNFLDSRANKLDAIAVTGGEPTLHKDLPEFIAHIKSLGYLVKLDSNGTNPEVIRHLIDKKLIDYIAMDIKGPLEKYSEITNRPVNTDAIKQSIDLIMKSGVDYELRTTIVSGQLDFTDFEKIGKMIKGAKRYAIQKFVSGKTNNPAFAKRSAYSDEDMEKIKVIMLKYVNSCVIH